MSEIQLPKKFSIRDLLKRGWNIVSQNLGKILLLELLFLLLFGLGYLLINFLFPPVNSTNVYILFLNSFFQQALITLFSLGATTLALKFSNFEDVKISDFFSKLKSLPNLFFATLLVGFSILPALVVFLVPTLALLVNYHPFENTLVDLGLVLGFTLFILSVLFLATRFSLFSYFIIDQKAGIIESIKKSWTTVRGASWKVLAFIIVCALLNILGALFLGFGVLLTYPVTAIAFALLYRTLWTQSNVTVLADERKE